MRVQTGAKAAAAGSAFAAFIDLNAEDQDQVAGEKERQRKFLLQIQRTKWLAQHGKMAAGATSGNGTGASLGIDLAKSVRMKELQNDHGLG